jgi:2-polyprenyl-6-methoxyphenol hydroxylase-like FAD-dependent oxidoreductase
VSVNWIAELKFAADHQWRREDWNRAGRVEDFLPRFADWNFDWLDVSALVRGADAIYEYPMVDRDPLPRWTHGRVTLLGDAAHPMYPIGSNGASQAILDARVLTRELQTHGVGPQALQAYEAERRPATATIVQANRRSGPDEILDLIENRAPDGFDSIEDVASRDECEAIAAKYRKIAGFDKDALNSRPSIVEVVS